MKRGISVDIYDVLAGVGALAFAAGVGMIYLPAGVIVLGLAVLAAGLLAARSHARVKR